MTSSDLLCQITYEALGMLLRQRGVSTLALGFMRALLTDSSNQPRWKSYQGRWLPWEK